MELPREKQGKPRAAGTARSTRLRERAALVGLRMTPQRAVLLRALAETHTHPTADALCRMVRRVLPTVSQATVYRNLQELVRAGLIATLERAGGAVQYDPNPDDHHHFICSRCERVSDIYLKDVGYAIDRVRSSAVPGRIERAELQLHGLCDRCASPRRRDAAKKNNS